MQSKQDNAITLLQTFGKSPNLLRKLRSEDHKLVLKLILWLKTISLFTSKILRQLDYKFCLHPAV